MGALLNGPLVSFRGVSKRYGQLLALDGMDLELRRGEVYGFIGPNGAGKTTSIKVMIGLMEDFEGEVTIGGRPMPSSRREVHRSLGYLPQDVAFQEWRTVGHVLDTFGRLSGLRPPELEERIQWALDLVGISDRRDQRVTQLSGGTHQKVGMAQAILHRPELLVLDEPMSGLDPESRFRFKEIIKQLNREGATVFFSSHILSDVQDVATRIGIISRGRLRWSGSMEELKDHFEQSHDYMVVLSRPCKDWRDVEGVGGVEGLEPTGEGAFLVHISRDVDADEVADQIVNCLVERGGRIRSINPVSPTLEQLYMRYVQEDVTGEPAPNGSAPPGVAP